VYYTQFQEADNPKQICDTLARCYGATDFEIRSRQPSRGGSTTFVKLKDIGLCHNAVSAAFKFRLPCDGMVRQHFVRSGRSRMTIGQKDFNLAPNSAVLIPASADVICDFDGDYAQFILQISEAALQSKLSALTGNRSAGNSTSAPVCRRPRRRWRGSGAWSSTSSRK
jgi:hypothetical protein